jgi:hypothetical protein
MPNAKRDAEQKEEAAAAEWHGGNTIMSVKGHSHFLVPPTLSAKSLKTFRQLPMATSSGRI